MNHEFKPFDLGRYHCVEIIGSGNTAIVYKAVLHTVAGFEKVYALKKIHPHLLDDMAFMRRFLQETRISAMLDHGNIAHVRELNKDEGCYYLVVEFIEGHDLRSVLDRIEKMKKRLPWELAAYIAMETAKALSYIHDKRGDKGEQLNLVHRSLSPSNVILSRSGEVKLVDFGMSEAFLAGGSSPGALKKKYAYMSPEQLSGESIDSRSDIFALGALFYEMLAGKTLFKGETDEDTIRLVKEAKALPIRDAEPLLDAVLAKMSTGNPENRFNRAEDIMTALNRILMVRAKSVFEKDLAEYLSRLFGEPEPDVATENQVVFGSPAEGGYRSYDTDEASLIATEVYGDASYKRVPSSEESSDATTNVETPNRRMSGRAIPVQHYEKEISTNSALGTYDSNIGYTPLRLEDAWKYTGAGRPPFVQQTPPSLVLPRPHVVSSCEPEYGLQPGHFLPAERVASPRREDPPSRRKFESKPEIKPAWTFKNRLILVLALMSILVASAALYIVFSSDDKTSTPASASWTTHDGSDKESGSVQVPETRETKQDNATEITETGTPDGPEEKEIQDPEKKPVSEKSDEEKALDEGDDKRFVLPGGIQTAKATGPRSRGDLDLHTQPNGASVIVDDSVVAKTPVRFKMKEGQTLEVVLNKEGRRLKTEELRAPGDSDSGRMLKVFLPNVRKQAEKAEPGHTAVSVKCKISDIYRIYLNGWDTGFNCPVTIRVDPGNNNLARRIKPEARLDYKDFRVHTGHTAIIDWDK